MLPLEAIEPAPFRHRHEDDTSVAGCCSEAAASS